MYKLNPRPCSIFCHLHQWRGVGTTPWRSAPDCRRPSRKKKQSMRLDQGLRHADENGGDGDQAAAKPGFSSEGNPYQKPKTQRIWPTIFLKMRGIIPRTLKNGGTRPPVSAPPPPCGGATGLHGISRMHILFLVLGQHLISLDQVNGQIFAKIDIFCFTRS